MALYTVHMAWRVGTDAMKSDTRVKCHCAVLKDP